MYMDYLALTGAELDGSAPIGFKFRGGTGTIGAVISDALPYVFAFAGFALIAFIIFSGYSLMMSKGDERAVAAAKAKLTYGVMGFLVVFASYWIVSAFGGILNLPQVTSIFR